MNALGQVREWTEHVKLPASTSPRRDFLLIGGISAGSAYLSQKLAPAPNAGLTRLWYDTLRKPAFTPPRGAFAPVWSVLYTTTSVAAWRVWKAPPSPQRTKALACWATHLGLATAWSRLFFGQRRSAASLGDISLDLLAAAGFTYYAARTDKAAGYLAAPLPLWLGIATAVNAEIVRRNPRRFK